MTHPASKTLHFDNKSRKKHVKHNCRRQDEYQSKYHSYLVLFLCRYYLPFLLSFPHTYKAAPITYTATAARSLRKCQPCPFISLTNNQTHDLSFIDKCQTLFQLFGPNKKPFCASFSTTSPSVWLLGPVSPHFSCHNNTVNSATAAIQFNLHK